MTIEERAYEYYPIIRGDNTANDAGWEGYIKGATEQDTITKNEMIEKVCEWLIENFYHEETMVDCIAYRNEDYDVDIMIEDFKKAMKE